MRFRNYLFLIVIPTLLATIYFIGLVPTTYAMISLNSGPTDTCGLVNFDINQSPVCPNESLPNFTMTYDLVTVSATSNDGKPHAITYMTGTNVCQPGLLEDNTGAAGPPGECNAYGKTSGLDTTQTVSVPTSIDMFRTYNNTDCGSYQEDFYVFSVDGNTSCHYGYWSAVPGANSLCQTGNSCTGTPDELYQISGSVYTDLNKNGIEDPGESNYAQTPTITASGGKVFTHPDGSYTVADLPKGDYTISYNSLPLGFAITSPLNGPPPSYQVRVGPGCASNKDGECDEKDNVANLNFGITNTHPWFQSSCGDIRNDNGITDLLPTGELANITDATCTNPGISFTGDTDPVLGNGQESATNQQAGGGSYPELFSHFPALQTSYYSLLSKAQNAGITTTDLATVCNLSNCILPPNLPHGIYQVTGLNNMPLDVTLKAYNFGNNNNYVFLINGTLTIDGALSIPNDPTASTALFATTKDIIVSPTVGSAVTNTASDIAGWFIAGQNFIVQSQGNCNDLRLNIAGTVVANALGNGGTFQNSRDLCGSDTTYPTVSFTQQLTMILNAPEFLRQQKTVSQELAP